MSEYGTYDFTESLGAARIALADIDKVIAAWGYSPEGYGSWTGGFLLAMKDGRFAYVWGWCDTTGWGCQDGGGVEWLPENPVEAILAGKTDVLGGHGPEAGESWDLDPADLNRALKGNDPEKEVVR